MNRFFTLVIAGMLFIGFTSFFKIFQNGVTIAVEMPDVMEAGSEATVNVSINKGKLTGFARFQQELPYGFTAVPVNSANADFSFEDQKVRLVWLQIPSDDVVVISYKIVANERLTGRIDLNGRFSYIDNNERRQVDQQPVLLAITPSPNVSPEAQIDVLEYAKAASIEAVAAKGGHAVALRQQPVWMEEDRMFLVTLLINRDAVRKFAKIEETVPEGYVAANIDSRGGIFTFTNRMAKFIWMDMPSDPYFTVSYKLVPEDGVTPDPASMPLAGLFSYMIGDRTYTSEVVGRQETLAGLSSAQLAEILSGVAVQATEQQQPAVAVVTPPPVTPPSSTAQGAAPGATTTPTTSQPTQPSTTPGTAIVSAGDLLKPESGIYYRVQIAAGHKPVNTQRYFRRYRLEYSVMKEVHEEWFKYSVGSFAEYVDARDYRVHLGNTTKINDAFVAAYNNGNRITVQDALMALNQKWVK